MIVTTLLLPSLLLLLLLSSMIIIASSASIPPTSSSIATHVQQHNQQNQQVHTRYKAGYLFNETQAFQFAHPNSDYDMRCHFENSIEPVEAADHLDDITLERYKQTLIDATNVTWLRYFDSKKTPKRIHRFNGERIDGLAKDFNDKPRITLHQVGTSDQGVYECRIHWPDVELIKYFRLPAKITFLFSVSKEPPDAKLPFHHNHNNYKKQYKTSNQNKLNALASQESPKSNLTFVQFIVALCIVSLFMIICVISAIYYSFRYCQTPLQEKNFPNLQSNIPYNKGIVDQDQNNSNHPNTNLNHQPLEPNLDNCLNIHNQHHSRNCKHHDRRQLSYPINQHSLCLSGSGKNLCNTIDSSTIFHPQDMYNVDGFITGHLQQESGHHLAQSINTSVFAIKGSKNPSISSSSSHQSHSDEASTSSSSHGGDNCRLTVYQHTSNTTSTTVPVYDHPNGNNNNNNCNHSNQHHVIEMNQAQVVPSMKAEQDQMNHMQGQNQQLKAALICSTDHCKQVLIENACVSNPSYVGLDTIPNENSYLGPIQERFLVKMRELGRGEFGEVFQYGWMKKDGKCVGYVAIKELHRYEESKKEDFMREIALMQSVDHHPNVIRYITCLMNDPKNPKIVMEYAEKGDLRSYLRKCRLVLSNTQHIHNSRLSSDQPDCQDGNTISHITSQDLLRFARDIARGMEYISSKGVVHRDLATRNILLGANNLCKIADFGFARNINEGSAYRRASDSTKIPVKWMPPETLTDNIFTTQSDVYSFGIVMWEIVTLGGSPYEDLETKQVIAMVKAGKRMSKPDHCREELWSIIDKCWVQNYTERPSFGELACGLDELLPNKNDYIELDQYNSEADYYNILDIPEFEEVNL